MRVLVVGGVSLNTIIHLDRLPDPTPQTVYARDAYTMVGLQIVSRRDELAMPVLHPVIVVDIHPQRLAVRDHMPAVVLDAGSPRSRIADQPAFSERRQRWKFLAACPPAFSALAKRGHQLRHQSHAEL